MSCKENGMKKIEGKLYRVPCSVGILNVLRMMHFVKNRLCWKNLYHDELLILLGTLFLVT